MIGTTLRQYVIQSPLGKGGMGEVWLARDTTLDRDVALKILPLDSSDDTATRKERFFREAKAASALNHPNIVTIHEINHDQGFDFIAMEYVDGRTLASLLRPDMPIAEIEKLRDADRRRRRPRASCQHRPSRPETRQHHGDPRRAREGPRLWARQGPADPSRRGGRDRRGHSETRADA